MKHAALEPGARVMLRPDELSPHALAANQPWMNADRFGSFAEEVRQNGVIEELLVTPAREIANGRHRWKSLLCAPWLTQACLPCRVVAEDEVAGIILKTTVNRRHFTKSAQAFMALPLMAEACREADARSAANLKKGGGSRQGTQYLIGEKRVSPVADLALNLGVSEGLLKLARGTEGYFVESDRRLEKWLHDNPNEWKLWEQFRAVPDQVGTWTHFRAERLADMGEDPKDPGTASRFPEDYRAIFTARLFSDVPTDEEETGAMSLRQINKAMGSILTTKGKTRGDLKDDEAQSGLHLTLCNKLVSFNKTMWRSWSELPVAGRAEVVNELTAGLAAWPQEARLATYQKLKDELKK